MATKRSRDELQSEQCSSCGRYFDNEDDLNNHIHRIHNPDGKTSFIKCDNCHRVIYGISLNEHKTVAMDTCFPHTLSTSSTTTTLASSSSSTSTMEEELPSSPRFEDLFEYNEKKDYIGK